MRKDERTEPHANPLLDAALAYAARGIPVFPLIPRDKKPATENGFKDATTDAQQIRDWWRKWRQANIGVPTGRASGWLAIDIDSKAGATYDTLAALGRLPQTLLAQTPSGGLHLVFAYPASGEAVRNSASKIAPGIDVRGEGGYIVVAPSRTTNGQYEWVNDLDEQPAPCPAWLLKLARDKPQPAYRERALVAPTAIRKPGATRDEDDRDAYWLAWALAQAQPGTSDHVGFLLAQQLLLDPAVRDADMVLARYAQRATFNAHDPFTPRDVDRWLVSAQDSELVRRGEPARSQVARPLRRERPMLREVPPTTDEPENVTHLPTPEETPARRSYHRTEMGNAERLLDAYHERLAYTKAAGYMAWDGRRWVPGAELVIEQWAKIVIRAMYEEAADLATQAAQEADESARQMAASEAQDLMKWAVSSEKAKMVSAMLMLARSACAVDINHFDKEPWLFNCQNGTVDLRTGALRPHQRTDYLTQISPIAYDPHAACPRFAQFVREILLDDEEMVRYLQKVLGYALTGDVSPQEWYLLVGEGENGKSVLMETVAAILGDYAHMMAPETITITGQTRKGQEASPDIAMLKGKRFVRVTETQEGARIDAAQIKSLSGSDEKTARFLHRDLFTFRPVAKMFIYTNHRPETRETTHAFWRRVRYIPFDLNLKDHPERKDEKLPEKLRAELPGILAWMVRGCLAWQREGLKAPKRVLEATEAYRADSDVLRDFIESRCVARAGCEVRAAQLYKAYGEWCKDAGEHQQNMRRFGKAITERGFERKTNNGIIYVGLGLRGDIEQGTLD